MAFQSLVVNCWPSDQFLPGEDYQKDARNLRLLTRECEGEYILVKLEDSLILPDKREFSEEENKIYTSQNCNYMNNSDFVKVDLLSVSEDE